LASASFRRWIAFCFVILFIFMGILVGFLV
jgi:hypothetical protein